jgi:hypothetical protein
MVSFPRKRESSLLVLFATRSSLDARLRGHDEYGRRGFACELIISERETRNPKLETVIHNLPHNTLATVTTASAVGTVWSSSTGENGTGTSIAPIRFTGASR